MKKIVLIISLITVLLIQYSCTNNDDTDPSQLVAYASFGNTPPPPIFSDPQGIEYTGQIIDVNNNLFDYVVAVTAIIGGKEYEDKNFATITNFPSSFSFSSQSLANALGLTPDDFNFGDSFTFTASATRNDSVLFTSDSLLLDDNEVLNSAMTFDFVIACEAFEPAKLVGSWTVETDDWGDYTPGDEVIVEAGPDSNTFHILNTNNLEIGNPDTAYLIVTVNDSGDVIDIKTNEPYDYGVDIDLLNGGDGLVVSCAGIININIEFALSDGSESYGAYNFVINKTSN